jgi:hypothetical protein
MFDIPREHCKLSLYDIMGQMKLLNIVKKNNALKGIIIGLFSFLVLEFGTLAVMAGFETDRQWRITQYYEGNKIYYFVIFNVLIALLLGIGIATKSTTLKRVGLILNIVMFALIIGGYFYFVWLRFHLN